MEDLFSNGFMQYDKLSDIGFKKDEQGRYIYRSLILNGYFELIITIENDKISSKVIDKLFNEEYRGYLEKDSLTAYEQDIYTEYLKVINAIKETCIIHKQ